MVRLSCSCKQSCGSQNADRKLLLSQWQQRWVWKLNHHFILY